MAKKPPLVIILEIILQEILTKVLHVTTAPVVQQPIANALLIRVLKHVIIHRTVQDWEFHAFLLLRTENGKSVEAPFPPSAFQRKAEDALLPLRLVPIPLVEGTGVRNAKHRR